MDNWKTYLRGKVPMGAVQPVQTCGSLAQVAKVMEDGIAADQLDSELASLDALADQL